jgi:SAM-dependent methyltransferase
LLDRAGVGEGMLCLDVGCGTGEVMRLLAQRVGPDGLVVGMDVDAAIGQEMLETLGTSTPGRCEFVEADVREVEQLDTRYDVVVARLLLMHMTDPVDVVGKLYGWVAPGGVLVLQDYDTRTAGTFPEIEHWDEFVRVVDGAFEVLGRDPRCGTKLPAHLVAAGAGSPDEIDVAGVLVSMPESDGMCVNIYRSLLPIALAHGLTTEERSGAYLTAATAALDDEHTYLMMPNLVGVVRRKCSAPSAAKCSSTTGAHGGAPPP